MPPCATQMTLVRFISVNTKNSFGILSFDRLHSLLVTQEWTSQQRERSTAAIPRHAIQERVDLIIRTRRINVVTALRILHI